MPSAAAIKFSEDKPGGSTIGSLGERVEEADGSLNFRIKDTGNKYVDNAVGVTGSGAPYFAIDACSGDISLLKSTISHHVRHTYRVIVEVSIFIDGQTTVVGDIPLKIFVTDGESAFGSHADPGQDFNHA